MANVKQIIRAKYLPGFGFNVLSPEASRAIPNDRLKKAFGIANAFTSHDAAFILKFRQNVNSLLNIRQDVWHDLAVELDMVFNESHFAEALPLASIAQCSAMLTALRVLFSRPMSELDLDDVKFVADYVHTAWLKSKDSNALDVSPFSDDLVIQFFLESFCPGIDVERPAENPLNLILPAFETMWRVVLRLVLVVRDELEWREMLIQAVERSPNSAPHPTEDKDAVTVTDLVTEALRLYPPTRRVYRMWEFPTSAADVVTKRKLVRADIEQAHLDTGFWGEDAAIFNPRRWHGGSHCHAEIMSFGAGKFTCPAKHDFAPKAIAMMAGVILRRFDVLNGPESPVLERLDNDREGYFDVMAARREKVAPFEC
ncbi:hypothetical protein KEM52_003007 [Ascosphaera acerosa]|nr:hypothetical protein KEM52_003007 [Ascosphaera acerosa]